MPTYEYACDSCGHNFEAFQKMSEAPLSSCPSCGKNVRRVLSGGLGISFKGSGFYVNDSSSGQKSAKKEPAASPSSACSGSSCCATCSGSGS